MPSDVEILQEMGFPENRAAKALAKTNYRGAQVAMDWLLEHQDDPDIDDPFEAPQGHKLGSATSEEKDASSMETDEANKPPAGEGGQALEEGGQASEEGGQAKSLKCEDCGKLLKSELDVQAHASRTGHANFAESTEEIKPLTEEEKKKQLEMLQQRLAARRREKEEEEKKQTIEKEKIRRKQGRELVQAKQALQDQEMKRIADMKRKEKEEERKARQKIKEEIERDKRERALKFPKQGAAPVAAAAPSPAAQPAPPAEKKTYDECRLQIRLTNGQALTQVFQAKEQFASVRLYVQLNRTDGDGPFSLMTSFPRKVFSEEDMEKPLTELGLVPSAVLMVTKK